MNALQEIADFYRELAKEKQHHHEQIMECVRAKSPLWTRNRQGADYEPVPAQGPNYIEIIFCDPTWGMSVGDGEPSEEGDECFAHVLLYQKTSAELNALRKKADAIYEEMWK